MAQHEQQKFTHVNELKNMKSLHYEKQCNHKGPD